MPIFLFHSFSSCVAPGIPMAVEAAMESILDQTPETLQL